MFSETNLYEASYEDLTLVDLVVGLLCERPEEFAAGARWIDDKYPTDFGGAVRAVRHEAKSTRGALADPALVEVVLILTALMRPESVGRLPARVCRLQETPWAGVQAAVGDHHSWSPGRREIAEVCYDDGWVRLFRRAVSRKGGILAVLAGEVSGPSAPTTKPGSEARDRSLPTSTSQGLDPTDNRILRFLEERREQRFITAAIAKALNLKEKSIGKNLSKLTQAGLIENIKRHGYRIVSSS